jgi:hypothetical protein
MSAPDLLYDRFRAVLAEELRRSDLEAWMRTHRAEVEALLAEGDMDWAQAAKHFAAAGLRVKGEKPNAGSTEAAWRRVATSTSTRGRVRPQQPLDMARRSGIPKRSGSGG